MIYIWLLISCIKTCTVKGKSNCRPFLDFHHCKAICTMTAFLLIWLTVCSQNVGNDRKYLEFLNLNCKYQFDCSLTASSSWLQRGCMLTACEVIQKPKIERNTVHLQFPQNSQTGVIKQVNYSQKKVKKKSCCSTANLVRELPASNFPSIKTQRC